jgi:hypothetical protein
MEATIAIAFHSEWLVSSGQGDGHLTEATLVRDANGLIFLPGRAIKGALREGAHRLCLARPDLAQVESVIFGAHCQPNTPEGPAKSFNQPGLIRVSAGRLPKELEVSLLAEKPEDRLTFVNDLTVRKSQSALTEGGMIKVGSSRVTERGIPGLVFFAEISLASKNLKDAWLKQYFSAACAMVKGLGGHRSRGLGHCRVTLVDAPEGAKITLPPALPVTVLQ